MQNIEFHEIANIFPLIRGKEFVDLKEDIKQNGLLEPIWMFEDKILDGRNRFRACQETGVQPKFREYTGGIPLSFVVSLNLHRRHLSESQRAMAGASIANLNHGQKKADTAIAVTQSEVAESLKISEDSIQRAKKVQEKGDVSLIESVQDGRVSVSAAANVAELPKEEQAEIVAKGEKEILEAAKKIRSEKAEKKREERIVKINEISKNNAVLNDGIGTFPVIYADPPWRYEYAETESRAIENQYPTMSLEEICKMPVSDISQDDCVLFLWTTSPKLKDSMDVLSAWGFEYRTCAVWDKQKIGMGYYFRQQHEILLIATKGSLPVPKPSDRISSVLSYPREKHSKKPIEFYEIIESMYEGLEKIELFCRKPREGWSVWGNQSNG